MKNRLILIIALLIFASFYILWYDNPSNEIDRDTSNNTVIYETFDDGNCGELGYCPPPLGY